MSDGLPIEGLRFRRLLAAVLSALVGALLLASAPADAAQQRPGGSLVQLKGTAGCLTDSSTPKPSCKPVQDYVVFTYDDYQAGQDSPPYVKPPQHLIAIREQRFKIAKYYDAKRRVKPQWEMYDLKNDPDERFNLAAPQFSRNAKIQSQLDRLKKKLERVERERLQPLSYMAFKVRNCRLKNNRVVSSMRCPGKGIIEQEITAQLDGEKVVLGKKQKGVQVAGVTALNVSLDNTELGIVEATRRSLTIVTRFIPNGGPTVTDTRRLKPS